MSNERLYRSVAFVAARHISHYQAIIQAIGTLGAWLMKQSAPEIFAHAEQVLRQGNELQELRILQAFYELKTMATKDGGWEESHGVPLDQIAETLIERCGWDADNVCDFVQELTNGEFSYEDGDDDDNDYAVKQF